ncbi:MAG: hypothetical protein M3Y80_01010, partial [Verrucomicrobiota bacterium]|nr:hypothetical protein [Verrucomicrobiota bacterium]
MEPSLITETSGGVAVAEPPTAVASLHLNQLQALAPAELDELCAQFAVRSPGGRNRHHQIVDLVRAALSRGTPVTVEGFYDQVADSFGLLRFPALNFLPVPEEVGIPRGTTQRFRFRLGQLISGTVRLPRDREKSLMLDEVTAIEGNPVAEWQELTEFDNLTPLYPEGRIFLENT